MLQCWSLHSSHSLLPLLCSQVCLSVLCVCVSTAALQIGSSVPFFLTPYICVNLWYLFFSFWLTSLCITGSRFIHFTESKSRSVTEVRLLCDPMDYTVRGILQATILEWVAFPFSKGCSQLRDRTQVSYIAGGFFTSWATLELTQIHSFLWLSNIPLYMYHSLSIHLLMDKLILLTTLRSLCGTCKCSINL